MRAKARWLYSGLYYLLIPFVLMRLKWRSRRAPAYAQRWSERFGHFPPPKQTGGIWFHTVSVGETIAAAPLIKQIQSTYPNLPVCITTMTPTGSERVSALFGDSVFHVYVPYDTPAAVKRFLGKVQPKLAVMMETELWPNIVHQCHSAEIPLVIANARLSARSAKGYARFDGLTRPMLNEVSLVAAQAETDGKRFVELGLTADRLAVTGSVKFDIQVDEALKTKAQDLRQAWNLTERPVWIAASTHEGEDEQVLQAQQKILAQYPDALLLLVPRHPERFDSVFKLISDSGLKVQRRSQITQVDGATQVLLGDSMGELLTLFGVADLAYVGGSLVPTGGHNMLEPAAMEVPVITGPHLFNFTDVSRLMQEAGALRQVSSAEELGSALVELFASETAKEKMRAAGSEVVKTNAGAQQRLFDLLTPLITQ